MVSRYLCPITCWIGADSLPGELGEEGFHLHLWGAIVATLGDEPRESCNPGDVGVFCGQRQVLQPQCFTGFVDGRFEVHYATGVAELWFGLLFPSLSWYCQKRASRSGMTASAHPISRQASSHLRHLRSPSMEASGGRTKRVEPTAGSLVFECSLVMVTSLVFAAVAHPQRSVTEISPLLLGHRAGSARCPGPRSVSLLRSLWSATGRRALPRCSSRCGARSPNQPASANRRIAFQVYSYVSGRRSLSRHVLRYEASRTTYRPSGDPVYRPRWFYIAAPRAGVSPAVSEAERRTRRCTQ